MKRTRDAALAIGKQYYRTPSERIYYAGGSKGGHEGLVAAQRYGADYDGVIAYYPANQNQAMVLSWFDMWRRAYLQPGGALNLAEQQFLQSEVLERCDTLDGVADGVVSNLKGCETAFSVDALRCPDGGDTGDACFSDTQIATLRAAASPMQFAFPLANGVTSMGPYPVFLGGDVTGILFSPLGVGEATGYYGLADGVVRYFIQQDSSATLAGFDYRDWQPRVEQISRMYDATSTDVEAFRQKGAS